MKKLLTILSADIQEYASMMEEDETFARQRLDKFHFTIATTIAEYKGKVVNNYGDGCICTFDNAIDAMHFAKEMQTIFYIVPSLDTGRVKVLVRIGLHSGEVFFEEGEIYGDSVNIASQIESLGVAGSILFSNTIKKNIVNQSDFKIHYLGDLELEEVEQSMKIFALANEGLIIP